MVHIGVITHLPFTNFLAHPSRPFLRLAKRYFTTAEVQTLQKLEEEWNVELTVTSCKRERKGAMNGANGGIYWDAHGT